MLRLGLLLLIIPGLVLMGAFWSELSTVNECVAAGGSYDYLNGLCDMQLNHRFVPYFERNPMFVNMTMLASGLGFLLCLFGLYVKAR
ncbi:hypothetical protein [Amphritea balenae]|uniref:Uncharacterized protein n=1 Tax=Amphritea balenae TaxID=452629 RepID=A0A3P1SNI3_9GAMM|nr:hypothetical protein [Amphritea balenae]RRC98811.1 hypothetical protein EHS89_11515 [Amphritea balenae]GGK61932.1 hypothetical protein GCM10007941_10020 [Amphritea balenae]